MCLIIHKPAGKKLPDSVYQNGVSVNGDGLGWCYINDGHLVINKGMLKADGLIAAMNDLTDKEVVVHMRRASPGMVVSENNCHPFYYKLKSQENTRFAAVHNGRLTWRVEKGSTDTETWLNDRLWPHLEDDPWFLNRKTGQGFIEDSIGSTNKMVFMKLQTTADAVNPHQIVHKQSVVIINRKMGWDDHGCWFSNRSYLPKVVHVQEFLPGHVNGNHSYGYWLNGVFVPNDKYDSPTGSKGVPADKERVKKIYELALSACNGSYAGSESKPEVEVVDDEPDQEADVIAMGTPVELLESDVARLEFQIDVAEAEREKLLDPLTKAERNSAKRAAKIFCESNPTVRKYTFSPDLTVYGKLAFTRFLLREYYRTTTGTSTNTDIHNFLSSLSEDDIVDLARLVG